MAQRSPHFRVEEIATGVHVAIATDGGQALSNGTILDLGGTTVVFDSLLTPAAGLDLRRAAERRTGRPPDFVVNSHYHGDHCRGNVSFRPARIVSTEWTRDKIRNSATRSIAEDRPYAARALATLRSGRSRVPDRDRALLEGWYQGILATPARQSVPPPDVTVDPELTIHGSRRSVRIVTFGGGHSPSDVLAFVPEDRIVLLGDLLSIGYHPSMSDGDPDRWLEILDRVLGLGVDRSVPGHGAVGTAPDIRQLSRYIRSLQRRARSLRARGVRRIPPGSARPPSPFDEWKFDDFYRENLQFVLDRTR